MQDLAGKRFIVAGGGGGMGAALVVRLVRAGARVVAGDMNETGLEAVAAQLRDAPGEVVVHPFDQSDDASINGLVQRSLDSFGGIDGVANTVADLSRETLGNDRTILDMDRAIWERTLQVNLIGHALLIQQAIPHMIRVGGGPIVVMSSAAAYAGSERMPAYAASKAGLQALVRHVANVCGKDNIRCNGVCPGTIRTEGAMVNMQPGQAEAAPDNALNRHGQADDVARVFAFLLSDEAAWITGQVISANGGSWFRD